MKQLLDTSDKYLIVGLSDRVFVGRFDREEEAEGVVVELNLRHDYNTPAMPVAAPSSSPSATAAETNNATNNPLEVQAVTLYKDKERLYCGVSCYNKSLLIYDIDLSELAPEKQQQSTLRTTAPVTVHKSFKRSGCLCFAKIQDDDDDSSVGSGTTSLIVLIAGDLSGDAVAFPLTVSASTALTDQSNGKVDVNEEVEETSNNRKLLLGHTGSMLTGLSMVTDGPTRRILTSDRDEKVRVSSFPNSFLIQGYLLGHEAFVSSMDVASVDGVTRCVTCGGDGTVRLWDYATCKELSSLSVSEGGLVVPSRVAMNPSGTRAAVIFDESSRLDILDASTGILQTLVSLNCSSAALAVAMLDDETLLVLVTKPPFLQEFRLIKVETQQPPTIEREFSFFTALGKAVGCTMTDGSMIPTLPTSVLEKDRFGEPMMKKNREKRGPAFDMPWNNAERKEIAKERERRYKKQKRLNKRTGVSSDDGTGE